MNKCFPTKELCLASLDDFVPGSVFIGVKNIIGIVVPRDNGYLFYSILDDCFFRTIEEYDYNNWPTGLRAKPINKPGVKLYEKFQKDFLTKEEIVRECHLTFGYCSDIEYGNYEDETLIDYEDQSMIDENIIDTVDEYVAKKEKPITASPGHIYGPGSAKPRQKIV